MVSLKLNCSSQLYHTGYLDVAESDYRIIAITPIVRFVLQTLNDCERSDSDGNNGYFRKPSSVLMDWNVHSVIEELSFLLNLVHKILNKIMWKKNEYQADQ